MTIPFRNIPQNLRTPLFFAEVDNSRANTALQTQRTLLIGQKTSLGIAAQDVVSICQGSSDAATYAGVNSRLASDVAAYRLGDATGELWIGTLADDPSAVAATGALTLTGAPTASGTLFLYLGGVLYTVPVTVGESLTSIAAAAVAIVNADVTCPVTASAAAGVITFTADSKGVIGNDYPLAVSINGQVQEPTPAGLVTTIAAMTGGTATPSLTNLLTAIGDQTFDFIVCPYSDTTTLDALKLFLNDQTGRWSYSQQTYGHVFSTKAGNFSALVTFGDARNNQHESCLGANAAPQPMSVWAATYTGVCAASLRADPARPLQTLTLPGIIAPPLASRFVLADRNTLLFNGISTFTVADDGTVALENVITTYQKNSFGGADDSYLQIETLFNLMFILRFLNARISSKFPRMKLADDGTTFAAGSAVVTPSIVRAELIAAYLQLEEDGNVQDSDTFTAEVIVQRNANNPNRLDVLFPAILIDQLRQLALLNQFRFTV